MWVEAATQQAKPRQPPRPSSLGTGRTPKPRTTPAGLARGSAPSSLLQGHPPSLRFGHPDVATEATETSTHPPNRCSYVFRKRPQGVTRTLSAAKQGGVERPGDGCPCVGAKETCSAPHSLGRREVPTHPTPAGAKRIICTSHNKTVFKRERKNPADSKESAGSFKSAPPGTRTQNPLIKSQLLCQLS